MNKNSSMKFEGKQEMGHDSQQCAVSVKNEFKLLVALANNVLQGLKNPSTDNQLQQKSQ